MQMFVFDRIDGVLEVTIPAEPDDSVYLEIYERRNEFLANSAKAPSYLLISYEDYLSLMKYALWYDRDDRYSAIWLQVSSGLDNKFLDMDVVIRPGPIQVVGKARMEFDWALAKQAKG